MYYTYVLVNRINGKTYVGYTSDLRRRLKEHASGNTLTTKRLKTTVLVFYEAFIDKRDATRREKYFKSTKGYSSLKQIIRYSLETPGC